jgi:hypothetical protein
MKTEEQWAEADEPVAYLTNQRQRLNIVINPIAYKSMPIAVEWEMPLYAKPQNKEWIGLTEDDDIDWENGGTIRDLFKAIDSKLKEKNGY